MTDQFKDNNSKILSEDAQFRFRGIARLFGEQGLVNLQQSHVMVIGLGGVGSWSAEALVRSGVGRLTLVDLDEICRSNINRQIHALENVVGHSKVKVMGKRLQEINPQVELHLIEDFYTDKTAEKIFTALFPVDFIVDAIDSLQFKIHLFLQCRERGIPLIITGAAGGKKDLRTLKVEDLGVSLNDNLLYRMRKKLRRDFLGERGRKKMGVDCVYSTEKIIETVAMESCEIEAEGDAGNLDCGGGLGSFCPMTSAMGMLAASYVIERLVARKEGKPSHVN